MSTEYKGFAEARALHTSAISYLNFKLASTQNVFFYFFITLYTGNVLILLDSELVHLLARFIIEIHICFLIF